MCMGHEASNTITVESIGVPCRFQGYLRILCSGGVTNTGAGVQGYNIFAQELSESPTGGNLSAAGGASVPSGRGQRSNLF